MTLQDVSKHGTRGGLDFTSLHVNFLPPTPQSRTSGDCSGAPICPVSPDQLSLIRFRVRSRSASHWPELLMSPRIFSPAPSDWPGFPIFFSNPAPSLCFPPERTHLLLCGPLVPLAPVRERLGSVQRPSPGPQTSLYQIQTCTTPKRTVSLPPASPRVHLLSFRVPRPPHVPLCKKPHHWHDLSMLTMY